MRTLVKKYFIKYISEGLSNSTKLTLNEIMPAMMEKIPEVKDKQLNVELIASIDHFYKYIN